LNAYDFIYCFSYHRPNEHLVAMDETQFSPIISAASLQSLPKFSQKWDWDCNHLRSLRFTDKILGFESFSTSTNWITLHWFDTEETAYESSEFTIENGTLAAKLVASGEVKSVSLVYFSKNGKNYYKLGTHLQTPEYPEIHALVKCKCKN
jgi:hypothetical protein